MFPRGGIGVGASAEESARPQEDVRQEIHSGHLGSPRSDAGSRQAGQRGGRPHWRCPGAFTDTRP